MIKNFSLFYKYYAKYEIGREEGIIHYFMVWVMVIIAPNSEGIEIRERWSQLQLWNYNLIFIKDTRAKHGDKTLLFSYYEKTIYNSQLKNFWESLSPIRFYYYIRTFNKFLTDGKVHIGYGKGKW